MKHVVEFDWDNWSNDEEEFPNMNLHLFNIETGRSIRLCTFQINERFGYSKANAADFKIMCTLK